MNSSTFSRVPLLDLRFADLDALFDVLAPDLLDQNAFEELLLQFLDVGALEFHLPDELVLVGQVHLLDGRFLPLVEVAVRHPEPALLGNLQDQGVVHDPFQHLGAEGGLDLGIVGDPESLPLDHDLPLQLAESDHVSVHERDNPVHDFDRPVVSDFLSAGEGSGDEQRQGSEDRGARHEDFLTGCGRGDVSTETGEAPG